MLLLCVSLQNNSSCFVLYKLRYILEVDGGTQSKVSQCDVTDKGQCCFYNNDSH